VANDGQLQKAIANPTRSFFVTMITRDISLEDCILDLIDNGVDGAWRGAGSRPIGLAADADLSKYSIAIHVSPDRFSIVDNCGGMTLDDAINHAFSFGRRATEEYDDYTQRGTLVTSSAELLERTSSLLPGSNQNNLQQPGQYE
jgi:hypothetical protein